MCIRDSHDDGLTVLGFPCDQFGHQEPGDEAEIKSFCSLNYDVTFPLYSKIDVNGDAAHPLWKWLKDEKGGLLGIEPLDPEHDRAMICGSPQMLADVRAILDGRGVTAAPRIGTPGQYVFERAFVET